MQTCLNKPKRSFALAIAGLLILLAFPVVAGDNNPYTKADEAWITIDGTVDRVSPDSFTLNYGDGIVVVEMDDGDRDADAYKLIKGDKVTVSGKIDDDFFETTTIEASSVFVENLGTTFFSSAMDEEDFEFVFADVTVPLVVARTSVRGWVTEVNKDEFLIDTGDSMLRVDVGSMPYDPLDNQGYQRIEVGDRVKVIGHMDRDLFEGRELEATTLIELYGAS